MVFNNLDLEGLIKKMKTADNNIKIKIRDISYTIDNNGSIKNNNDRLVIFGLNENISLLKDKKIAEFFFDTTFKIIPKEYKPYKMVTLSGLEKSANISRPILFICMQNNDYMSYIKLFETLKEYYYFNPEIFHSDYENAIAKALKEEKIFNKRPIHIKCNFHFSKAIRTNMQKAGMCKKIL